MIDPKNEYQVRALWNHLMTLEMVTDAIEKDDKDRLLELMQGRIVKYLADDLNMLLPEGFNLREYMKEHFPGYILPGVDYRYI